MTREVEYLNGLTRRLDQPTESQHWVYLTAPLTSTAWDGDARSTTAKTLIDLSTVFGVPSDVDAVLVSLEVRDSGSASTNCYVLLAPNATAGKGIGFYCPSVNDRWGRYGGAVIPCNADGDIYYQVVASGASTFDAVLEIWGYCL